VALTACEDLHPGGCCLSGFVAFRLTCQTKTHLHGDQYFSLSFNKRIVALKFAFPKKIR
jgi:hypothetical protein